MYYVVYCRKYVHIQWYTYIDYCRCVYWNGPEKTKVQKNFMLDWLNKVSCSYFRMKISMLKIRNNSHWFIMEKNIKLIFLKS